MPKRQTSVHKHLESNRQILFSSAAYGRYSLVISQTGKRSSLPEFFLSYLQKKYGDAAAMEWSYTLYENMRLCRSNHVLSSFYNILTGKVGNLQPNAALCPDIPVWQAAGKGSIPLQSSFISHSSPWGAAPSQKNKSKHWHALKRQPCPCKTWQALTAPSRASRRPHFFQTH